MSLFEKAVLEHNDRKAQWLKSRRPDRARFKMLWLTVTIEPIEVTVLSPLDWWYSHYQPALKRSRRCCGEECKLCEEGAAVQIRFVLIVQCEDGSRKLLELRERHEKEISEINDHKDGQVGAKIRLAKAWKAKNAPVVLELIGREPVVPIEASRIVRSLGLEALRK